MDFAWVLIQEMPTVTGLVVILLIVFLGVWVFRNPRPFMGYEKVGSLCTRRELMLWRMLDHKVNHGDYVVLAKVRLGDLIKITEGGKEGFRHLMKLNRKHVDFVIANRKSLAPIVAIELDDRSHNSRTRRERDKYVNSVFSIVKLPLLRIQTLKKIDGDRLRNIVDRIHYGHVPPNSRYPFGYIITGIES